jgi:hypothetical protein
MALQKTVSLKNNLGEQTIVENAYIKVDQVIFNKNKSFGIIQFKKSKDGNVMTINNFEFESFVGQNAKDAIAQGYDHIKSLPEFADAVDC